MSNRTKVPPRPEENITLLCILQSSKRKGPLKHVSTSRLNCSSIISTSIVPGENLQLTVFSMLRKRCATCGPRREVQPLVRPKAETNMKRWIDKLKPNPPSSDSLPPKSNAPRPTWKTLNGLRPGVGRTKANLIKWRYSIGNPSCNGGTQPQTMEHLLQWPLLKHLALVTI